MADITVGYGKDVATPQAFWAACSAYDRAVLYPVDAACRLVYTDNSWLVNGANTKPVSCIAGVPGITIVLPGSVQKFFNISGNLSAQTSQISFTGLTFVNSGNSSSVGIYYYDSSNTSPGILFDRCTFIGFGCGAEVDGCANGAGVFRSCLFIGCNNGAILYGSKSIMDNCTFIGSFLTGYAIAHAFKNNLFLGTTASPFSACTNVTGNNNSCPVATAPGTNPLAITWAQAAMLCGVQGFSPTDYRPTPSSSVLLAGVDSGATHDINNVAFTASQFPVGASLSPSFLEALCASDKILTGNSVTSIYGTVTNGNASGFTQAATPTSPEVLSTGDGISHTVNYSTTETGATAVEIQNASHTVLGIAKQYGEIIGIPQAITVHFHLLKDGKTLSEASATCVTEEIVANYGVAANKIIAPEKIQVDGEVTEGIATAEGHVANQVLKSAGGNYNDDNLSVGNIRPVAFGLSQTGTLANLAASDAAFVSLESTRNTLADTSKIPTTATGGPATWKQIGANCVGTVDLTAAMLAFEAGRNNDNGTVAADLATSKSFKTRNTTINGASDKVLSLSDEATRNADPGQGNTRLNTGYKICNVAKTGACRVPAAAHVEADYHYDDADSVVGTFAGGGSAPAMPLLSVEDRGAGVARFTISGSADGSTNRLFVRAANIAAWPEDPMAEIAGDGSADVILGAGAYIVKVLSEKGGITSPASNEPILFYLQDPDAAYQRSEFGQECNERDMALFLKEFGEPIQFVRGVQIVSTILSGTPLLGIPRKVITVRDVTTGADIPIGDSAWKLPADLIDFGSGPIVPRAQDQIIDSMGNVYVVVDAGTLDAQKIFWLVPTKRSEYKELST